MSAHAVMVVDDDEDIRDAFETLLRFKGYPVATVDDGDTALAQLQGATELPGIILLDLRMPRMSGERFLELIAADPRLRAIPIVILSGDADAAGIVAARRAEGFLRKPPEMSDLIATVARLMPDDGNPQLRPS